MTKIILIFEVSYSLFLSEHTLLAIGKFLALLYIMVMYRVSGILNFVLFFRYFRRFFWAYFCIITLLFRLAGRK